MNADTVVTDDSAALPQTDPSVIPAPDLGETVVVGGVAPLTASAGVTDPGDEADTVSVDAFDASAPAPSIPSARVDGDTVIVDGAADFAADFTTLPIEESIGADDYLLIVTRNGLARARPSSASPSAGAGSVFAGYMTGDDVSAHRALAFDSSSLVIHAQPGGGRYVFAGISTASAVAGTRVETIVSGPLEDATWGWVAGSPIFVTSNGVLTQIEPTTGIRHQVGVALSDKSMIVSPQPPSKAGATVLTVEDGAVTQRPLANLIGIDGPVPSSIPIYTELYGGDF